MIYDIIGDVHGHADKLIGLLTQLGYHHDGTSFVAPHNHQAIFIGDLIDRGSRQLDTLAIVFDMLDAGQALAIMGNHEYNAIAYATQNHHGNYLRPHSANNQFQHQAFLNEIPFGSPLHHYWLERFYELPLFMEFDDFIVIHACFDKYALDSLSPYLTNNRLSPDSLLQLCQNSDHLTALEHILKGIESIVPKPYHIVDASGNTRQNVRIAWWHELFKTPTDNKLLHTVSAASHCDMSSIPADYPYVGEFSILTDKPIFIGHYWLNGQPDLLSPQVVCVDYSAGKSGYLTAYQFDSDAPTLSRHNFVQYID